MAKKAAKKKVAPSKTRDILFIFDTTGSMASALGEVRKGVVATVKRLFKDIDFLRIGIIALGDYCDGKRITTILELTADQHAICSFVETVRPTHGGDAPEAYEVALHEAGRRDWQAEQRAVVVIGDEVPHRKGSRHEGGGTVQYDWMEEAKALVDSGIKIYPVQALGNRHAEAFYGHLAAVSGTPKIPLDQFTDMPDLLMALTYQNAGQLAQFQAQVDSGERRVSRSVRTTLNMLAGKPGELSKRSVRTGEKYEVFDVTRDCSIQGFVELQGLEFEKGRGFYEWMKSEIVQDYKQVIAQNIETGAIITGQRARDVLDIEIKSGRQKPTSETHRGFIQSTSTNRKLIAGTKFLYEVRKDEAALV